MSDFGTWDVAGSWDKAREFVAGVIVDSQGITADDKQFLQEEEQRLYDKHFENSIGLAWYSDDERKFDISVYAGDLYGIANNLPNLPEQVKKVFASFADTTHTIGKTKGQEYIENELKLPSWFLVLGAVGIFFVWKK